MMMMVVVERDACRRREERALDIYLFFIFCYIHLLRILSSTYK